MKEAKVAWSGGMSFTATTGTGHDILLDANPQVGGENKGPRPAELLLAGLGGCTGMDVVSILRKMRVEFDRFEMTVVADEALEHPKYFEHFHIIYKLWGKDVDPEKFRKAVTLSQEKYCSVSALFKKGAEVEYQLVLNDQPLT